MGKLIKDAKKWQEKQGVLITYELGRKLLLSPPLLAHKIFLRVKRDERGQGRFRKVI